MKILYTGDGGGKTIAAFGMGLRAWGHGMRVVVVQFMKGRKNTGEYKASRKLAGFQLKQFGSTDWVNLKNPSDRDKQRAENGLAFVRTIAKEKPELLVLDEIGLACAIGLLDTKEVVELLKKLPRSMIVVLTGRRAPRKLIDAVDVATEIRDIKGLKKRFPARKGFEY